MTAELRCTVSAPGKLMVMGEYAVLEGATALVMAVNRRVRLQFVPRSRPISDGSRAPGDHPPEITTVSPEIALALRLGSARLPTLDWNFLVDTSALQDDRRTKLGLGSSAAKAAASAAFVMQTTSPERILPLAIDAHRAVAPNGSGADVTACVLGGLLAVSPNTNPSSAPNVRRISFPDPLLWRAYFSGHSANTAKLIETLRSFAGENPRAHGEAMREVRMASEKFQSGCAQQSSSLCLEAVTEHFEAMSSLGKQAKVPIIDAALDRFCRELPDCAAAKPSGAGGGDVSIAFYNDRAAAEALDELAQKNGLQPLSIGLDQEGPRFE